MYLYLLNLESCFNNRKMNISSESVDITPLFGAQTSVEHPTSTVESESKAVVVEFVVSIKTSELQQMIENSVEAAQPKNARNLKGKIKLICGHK